MAICLTNYKIVITFADKTQKVMDVQAAQQLKTPQGAVLTLVDTTTGKPPAKLVTKRFPGQLVFEIEGEGVVTHVLDSDTAPAQVDNHVVLGSAIQQDITAASRPVAEVCAPAAVQTAPELMTVGSLSFLGAGTFGAIAGASALLSSKSGPSDSSVVARVVGGPVLAGNDLQAILYKADGISELGRGTITADGTVKVSVGNYTGVVVVKVQNNGGPSDPDNIPDYMDEATGQGKDLGNAVLYSMGELVQAGGTVYLNVNILTALAHLKATEIVGAGTPLDALTVRNTTAAIAAAFGLDDLTGDPIQTTITQTGVNSAQTANLYGEILAALSGADAQNNGDTQQTLLTLANNTVVTGGTATLQNAALEVLIEGAKTADPTNTMNLVNKLSDATTLSSSSVSIDAVAGENYVNASEAQEGVVISGTCTAGASVSLAIGGNVRNATVSGTTWSYTLISADITAMGQGAETLVATATHNGASVSASRGIYVDTVLPAVPSVIAVFSNDATPVITGYSNLSSSDERLSVTVNGATYAVTPDDSGYWVLDLGTSTPTNGSLGTLANGQTYPVVAKITDASGNATSDTSTNELVIDTSAPNLTISAVSGGYVNNAEDESTITISGTTDAENGRVVRLTLGGQSYTATVNAGAWSVPISSIALKALSEGTITLTADVSDTAGNNAVQATQSFVYDITTPATPATPSEYGDNVGALLNATSTAATTDDARPALRVPVNMVDALTLYVDGVAVAATYDASAGTLTPNSELPDGAHAFTYSLTDAAGNQSLPSGALNLVIDTTAPTAAAPLAYKDDAGAIQNLFSTAATTDDVRPGLRISANLSDTPKLYVNGVFVAASYDASTGTLTPTTDLAQGTWPITYTLTDAAGNESAPSAPLNITIDTMAPGTPSAAADLPATADMGSSSTDNITSVNRPGLYVGALPEGVTQIDLLIGGQVVTAVYDAQTGLLQPTSVLSDGTHAVSYRYTDAAGNQGLASPTLNLTIDTTAPAMPSAAPDLLNDTGSSNSDNNTSNSRPVLQVGALPSGVTGVELLVGGQKVAATYDGTTGQIRPDSALADGVHTVTYRYLDVAGNASNASASLSVTVDTIAPAATINTAAAGGISGTFEPGTALSLTIAGQAVTGTIVTNNSNGTWQYVPSSTELTALRAAGTKELLLTAADTAGNTASNSKTVTEDDFKGPYIKEFIPADGGVIANNSAGTSATLNLVFSKEVVKGTGNIQLFEVGNATAVATIDVTTNAVSIVGGNDIFITLPALVTGRQYYIRLASGTFVDLAGEAYVYAGPTTTGTNDWDFTAAAASIAPDFVAGDDLINAAENNGVVHITGKVVSSTAILSAITTGNLTVTVSTGSNAAITATVESYNTTTGEFSFSVPASAWAEGTYGYTVNLTGTTGAASGITASYAFTGLGVDLTAPTTMANVLGAQDNVGSITGDVWGSSSTALSDDTSPTLTGTLSATLSDDARVVVYRQDVTNSANPGALVRVTNSEGLKPAGTTWSLTDSGLQHGHSYKYLAYVEDTAGNRSPAGTLKTLSIDTQAPLATVTGVGLSNDTGISATDGITRVASQTLTGTLSHTLGTDERLLASFNGGLSWLDITGSVSGTAVSLSGVTLPAGSGSVWLQTADAAGNLGTQTSFDFTLDTTAPDAPLSAPDLQANEDSGSSDTDNLTNVNRPALVVGALPAGVSGIELLVNGQTVAASYNATTGTVQPTLALADGSAALSYRYVDAAGNQSGASPALSLTIDTTAPTSVQGIGLSADTGTSATDGITSTAAQTLSATLGAPLGAGDKVYGSLDNGSTWSDITSYVNGSAIAWTGVTLAGASTIQLQVRDAAGNVGATATQAYTLDTTAPATTISGLDISADTGTSATDFVTMTAAQTVTGTLSAALASGEQLFGSVDNGASWINITSKVSGTAISWNGVTLSGASSIQLHVRDAAGNAGTAATQAYTLDTSAPTTTISGLDISADTGALATDFVTTTAAQTITATLSAALATGEELYGSLDNGVNWTHITNKVSGTAVSWNGATLSGSSSIVLQVRDAAGNAGPSVAQIYKLEADGLPIGPVVLSSLAAGVGGFVINGQAASDYSGWSVSSAGDVNGDGLEDLLVGAYVSDPSGLANAGRSYVVFGKTSGAAVQLSAVAAGSGGFVINGQSAGEQNGNSVSNVGDINGDGLADIIVGSYSKNTSTLTWDGAAYVVFGKSDTNAVELSNVSDGSGGFVIRRTGVLGGFGNTLEPANVSGAGDVNGDGLADMILGGAAAINGSSYVVYGKTSGTAVEVSNLTAESTGFVISGSASAGWSTSNAGDVNGDGYADLIVGAPYQMNKGRSFVVFGQSAPSNVNLADVIAGSGGFLIDGGNNDSMSGYVVSAAGDVNGDGLADVVVGAPFTTASLNGKAGQIYVVYGKTSGGSVSLANIAAGNGGFLIQSSYYRAGETISTAGDINGDGLSDLIVGFKEGSFGEPTFVVYGKTNNSAVALSSLTSSSGTGGFMISSMRTNAVSAAGDVNGDGLDDLIVGVHGASVGVADKAGVSYVIFGATSGGAFSQSAVDWMGTVGDDTYAATAAGQTLVANQGHDTLASLGASVLYGGAGNDTFEIDADMLSALSTAGLVNGVLARIDGGTGLDTIKLLGSGQILDLTTIANQAASGPDGGSRIDSVEILDITGSGNNTLKLNRFDVLDMGRDSLLQTTGRQQLVVKGNAGDQVDLADGAGTSDWSQAANVAVNAVDYWVWNHNTSLATVYVQSGILVV